VHVGNDNKQYNTFDAKQNLLVLNTQTVGRVAQSVQRLSYGLDGPGSNPSRARFSAVQTGPGAHPPSCTMDTGSFPGVKCGWGVLLTTHPLLKPRSRKDRAIPVPILEAI
jgi:hypothetical protein